MKFKYNPEKNAILLAQRGIGFEEIITEVLLGNILEVFHHHNEQKYPNQKIMHVKCLGKIYLIPFVIEKNGDFFLKTIYPSRKATKFYLSKIK